MRPSAVLASTGLLLVGQLAATSPLSNLDIDRRPPAHPLDQQVSRQQQQHHEPHLELIINELQWKSSYLNEQPAPNEPPAQQTSNLTMTNPETNQTDLEANASQTHQQPPNSSNVLELSAFEAAHLGYFRHSTPTSVILAVAYSLVFLIGIVGNSFVVAIVCKSPRMRTVTNYFIANLALADILVLLFCLPATLISNLFIPYVLGLFVCKTVSYLQGVAVSASINTMVTVTMDRFLAICFPMDWHMSRRTARWTIAGIWLFSLTISAPWAVFFELLPFPLDSSTYIQVCSEHWPSERWANVYFIGANLILLYLLPACVIILCYLGIWYKIERRNIPGDRPKGLKIELIMQKSKVKVVKMMMVVVVIFLLSWLPVYLIVARIKFGPDERTPWEDWLITHMMPLAQWLGASNSCINPILYTFFNRKYKRDFMDLLGFAFCCNPIALRQDAHPLHHHHHHHQQQQQLRQRQLTAGGPFGASSANGATGTHLALSALSSSSSRGQRSTTGANQKRSHYVHAKQNNFSFNSADNNNNNSSVRKQTDHNQSDHHNYSSSGTATSNLRLASSVLTLGSTPNVRLADITNGNDFDGRAASMHTLHRPSIQLIVAPPLTAGRRPGNSGRPDNRRRSVGLPPVGADASSRSINYVDEQLGKQQQQQPDDEAAHLKRRRKRRQQEETHEPDVGRSGRQKRRRRRRRKRGEASTPGALIKRTVDRQPSVAQVELSATNNKARPSMGQIAGQQSNSSGSMRSSSRSSKQAKERPTWARTSLTARSNKDQTIKSNNTTDSTDTTAISLTTTTTTTTNGQVVVVAAASLAAPAANLQRLHNGELENQSAGMTDNDETDELDQAEAVDFRRYSDDLGQLDGQDNDNDYDDDGDWNEDEDGDEDEDDEEDLSEQSSLDEYSDELYVQRDYEEDNDNLLFGSTDDFPARESEIGRCLAASGTSLVSLRMHKLNKQKARLHPPSQSGSFTSTGEADPGGGGRPGCFGQPARPADEKSERSELKQTTIST